MAKKVKNLFVDYLEKAITNLEKLIVERQGTVPTDFEKLIRYQTVMQFYIEADN